MAVIVQRTFDGIPKKALSMCSAGDGFAGVSEVLSRPFAWGSNWKVVRMGILSCIGEYPSQSYDRAGGLYWGCCSGSRTPFDGVADTTCIGHQYGQTLFELGLGAQPLKFQQNTTTGSFFYSPVHAIARYITGSLSQTNGTPYNMTIYNGGNPIKRRSIQMLELSASGTTVFTKMYAMASSSMDSKNANRDYTEGDLIAILTSSVYPTASGVPMDIVSFNRTFDTASYPLDSAFLGYYGGIPLEIYNWYVYKVV